jgi:hypothetical protein
MLRCRFMLQLRNFLKDVLPPSALEWLRKSSLRRWILTARYLRYVSYEIQARSTRLETGQLEDLEARLVGPQGGLYRQIVEEVIERSDLLLKQLDRKLEGQGARQGERLRELEVEVKRLREAVDRLTEATRGDASLEPPPTNPPQENPLPRAVGRTSAASE